MFSLKQKSLFLVSILFLFSNLSFSKELKSNKEKEKALSFLKKTLNKYQSQSIHFKIEKHLFLPSLEENIKESGNFYIEKQKFRLEIKGDPSYFMVFNGKYLWYQPDIKEKIVFKLKDHPQIHLFFRLFDPHSFFKYFSILKISQKSEKVYLFQLKAKQNKEGIKEIFMEVGNYIQEIKVTWNDLGQWQKYKFFNPWFRKSFSKSKFQFFERNFEVIVKTQL